MQAPGRIPVGKRKNDDQTIFNPKDVELKIMAVEHEATTGASTAGAGAGEHRMQGMDSETSHAANTDVRGARVDDFVKDLGTDESMAVETAEMVRVWNANKKRTYDVHQSQDYAVSMANQRYANAETEQRLAHQSKLNALEIEMKSAEHNQRLRHSDAMNVMSTGVVGEMVEAIANKVCTQLVSMNKG